MFAISGVSHWRRSLMFVAIGAILFGATRFAVSQDGIQKTEKLPKGVTEISKEHLNTKVPNFFYFDYGGDSKRLWLRVDGRHWVERYPDGTESKFRILGSATANGKKGTIAVKTKGDPEKTGTENDGSFQVFIPDKGNQEMRFMFRNGDAEWSELADMKKVE
jgi:hypothetical protein